MRRQDKNKAIQNANLLTEQRYLKSNSLIRENSLGEPDLKRYLRLSARSQGNRPPIICNDGFTMSVQGSEGHYSEPREDGLHWYSEVEVGYPSEKVPELMDYIDGDPNGDYRTVYGYVPSELVQKIIDQHGGIDMKATARQGNWEISGSKNVEKSKYQPVDPQLNELDSEDLDTGGTFGLGDETGNVDEPSLDFVKNFHEKDSGDDIKKAMEFMNTGSLDARDIRDTLYYVAEEYGQSGDKFVAKFAKVLAEYKSKYSLSDFRKK